MASIRPIFSAVRRPSSSVDVVVVGAGAAGIAAARLCGAQGLTVAVVEARERVGGRAVTAEFAGHPIDLGAHWLHAGWLNPLVRLGLARGELLRRAPGQGPVVVEGRFVTKAERHGYADAFDRADRAFSIAAREEQDRSLASSFPLLGQWRRPAESTFALISGRPLDEVSVKDFPSDEFGDNYFVRGGYGAYLARLAAGLPVALGCAATAIDWSGEGVRVETSGGTFEARFAVVTAPLAVLAGGRLRFTPALPDELAAAIAGFRPGTYEHAVLNWPDAPFRASDRLAKLVSRRGSYGLLTRIDGAPFHYLELDQATVAGRTGQAGIAHLARDILADHFGGRALDRLRVLTVTDWTGDPWSGAAWAVAPPGHAGSRAILSRPVGDRIVFAGEANEQAMWGTAGGAWDSGEAAARTVAALLPPEMRGRSRVERHALVSNPSQRS